ncbi:MAG: GatB/YqeY domain-containing protein [Bacteroidales bacterium]
MTLFDTITADIKAAMLAGEKTRLAALRGVKKEFLEAKTAKGCEGELSDEMALKIIQKLIKQRKDSAEIYIAQNRSDLAEVELSEVNYLVNYLPKQLSEAEIEAHLKEIIAQVGANSAKDMGKVMGIASKALSGKAEGRLISELVKKLLG